MKTNGHHAEIVTPNSNHNQVGLSWTRIEFGLLTGKLCGAAILSYNTVDLSFWSQYCMIGDVNL